MAGRLVTLLLHLITRMLAMAADIEDSGSIEFYITKSTDGFSVDWDWDEHCTENVTFTAVYKKLGVPDSEPQKCVITEECSCQISFDLLDHSSNYTLLVSATTPDGRKLSAAKDFDPNCEAVPPPDFRVTASDALVMVEISTPDFLFKTYYLILRRNDSTEEKLAEVRSRTYIIPPCDLLPEQTYCLKMKESDSDKMTTTSFSQEECFTAPAKEPPNNLRMDARDTTYLLRWDWDFDQSPNATFSVEKCQKYNGCHKIKGCENITTTQCNCSELYFPGSHILRASVYDSQREERSTSVIQFHPSKDTIIGPPRNLTMKIAQKELLINVSAPEGFENMDIYYYCDWLTHLELWTNSTKNSAVKVLEDKQPFFKLDSLDVSTTYCAKAKMKCVTSNRSSVYSQVYCITTDPTSYLVVWITIFTIVAIVVISLTLYACLCPLKRYMKEIVFPSIKLPSSIEKGFEESPLSCIRHPFLLQEEETTDRCYIVQNTKKDDLVQISCKNSSQGNSQDSENYSSEGQTTEETVTSSE